MVAPEEVRVWMRLCCNSGPTTRISVLTSNRTLNELPCDCACIKFHIFWIASVRSLAECSAVTKMSR